MTKEIKKVEETIADEVLEVTEDVLDGVAGNSKILGLLTAPFRIVLALGKFGVRRFKKFRTKFRKFTNYATDDEKGPVIRFATWFGMRIGIGLGLVGGVILQNYVDVVKLVVDLFN